MFESRGKEYIFFFDIKAPLLRQLEFIRDSFLCKTRSGNRCYPTLKIADAFVPLPENRTHFNPSLLLETGISAAVAQFYGIYFREIIADNFSVDFAWN